MLSGVARAATAHVEEDVADCNEGQDHQINLPEDSSLLFCRIELIGIVEDSSNGSKVQPHPLAMLSLLFTWKVGSESLIVSFLLVIVSGFEEHWYCRSLTTWLP